MVGTASGCNGGDTAAAATKMMSNIGAIGVEAAAVGVEEKVVAQVVATRVDKYTVQRVL